MFFFCRGTELRTVLKLHNFPYQNELLDTLYYKSGNWSLVNIGYIVYVNKKQKQRKQHCEKNGNGTSRCIISFLSFFSFISFIPTKRWAHTRCL